MNFSSSSHSRCDKYCTMKIYDIISEEEQPGFLQTKYNGGNYTPPPAPVEPQPAPPSKSAKVAGTVKGAVGKAKDAVNTAKRVSKPVTDSWVSKKVANMVSGTPIYKVRAEAKIAKIGTAYLWFVKVFNAYEIGVGLISRWEAINDLAAKGELTGTDINAAKRIEAEKAVVEVTSTGITARVIMWVLRIITFGRLGSKIGGVAATILTGGTLGPAAFAEIFLVEAASLAFQQWLETPEGQEQVAWLVINCMDPTAVWLYNLGFGRMTGEIKGLSKSGEAAYTKNITPGEKSKPATAEPGSATELGATSDAGYMDKINQLIGKNSDAASSVPYSLTNYADISKLAKIPI